MGTTNDWNCSFMSKDEYNSSISTPIIILAKAEMKIKQLNKQLETHLAKQSTEATNSQQLFQQLEKDFLGSKKEVETLSNQNLKLQNDIKTLNAKNQELYEDSLKFKSNSIEKDTKSNTISKLYDELQNEKSNLLQIIERKEKDLKQESESVTNLTDKLNEFIKEKSELKSKLIAVENDQSSNQYQITRFKQEINELRKQNEQLEETNKKQTLNFYNEVKELKSINLELKIKNDSSMESIEKINQISNQQKEKITELENQLYQAKEEVRKIKQEKLEANGQFENELEVQKRLVSLLKENNDEFSKKITFLQGQIDQFKDNDRKLKRDHEEAYKKMEEAYEVLQEDYQKVIREYEDYKSSVVNKPAGQSNVDISQMDIPILSDQVKNRLTETSNLGSREDMRKELLDMVQRYDDLTKLALREKREKRLKEEQLNFVLSEVEKKAPIINEQHRDYQRILKSQDKLINNYKELQNQRDSDLLKASAIAADNNKLKMEIKDLQKQITYLLKEVLDNNNNATAGGSSSNLGNSQFNPSVSQSQQQQHQQQQFNFSSSRSNLNSSVSQSIFNSQAESDQIIPNSLITFSNIEELQLRNQELIKEIRLLKQDIQSHSESDKKLESALKELELLKSSRERQSEMIDSLVKQKEHWRSVAQHPTTSPSSSLNNNNNISTNGNDNDNDNMEPMSINDLNKSIIRPTSTIFGQSQSQHQSQQSSSFRNEHVDELKRSFSVLQKEYEQSTKERQQSEKEMFNKIEQLKDNNTTLKISLAQLESEKSMNQERLKLISDSLKSQSLELESYKKKCEEYTTAIINHQRSIESLSTNLYKSEDLRSQAENRVGSIKKENELLREAEARLLETNRSIINEKISIETLLERVTQLNSSKDSSESELRKRMENEVVQLEQVRSSLRKELDQEKQQHKETQMTLTHQLTESRERYDRREKDLSDSKEQLLKLKITEQNLLSKISSLENQVSNSESRLSNIFERQSSQNLTSETGTTPSTTSTSNISSSNDLDLKLARTEIESLKESLAQEKENVIHYKSIAISTESDLSKLREEYNKIKMELEEKINQLNRELSKNQEVIHEQQIKIEKLENFTNSHQKDIDDVIQAKENLVQEKKVLYDKIDTLTQELQVSLQESRVQHELYNKANEKYESEVILHAEHIKELPVLRSKLSDSLKSISSLDIQKENFSNEMKEAKQTWMEQENLLKTQIKELEERLKDIKHHNSLLQSQLDTMASKSNQIDKLNQMISNSGGQMNDETTKIIYELKEVVQLQSREIKILEVKNESTIQESIRFKQMLQHSQMEVESLNRQLLADQENMKNLTVSTWKHQEVLKQLEQMNLYKESNIMLKDETNKLNRKIEELSRSLEERDRKISPLTEENRKLYSENQVLLQEIEAQKIEISNWSNKAQKLLNKYQSIDPDEHQKLIEQNESKDQEIKNLNNSHEETKKSLEDVKKHAKHWKDEAKKLLAIKKEKGDIEAQKQTIEQQSLILKQQLEDAQKLNQTTQENYDKQILEIKKKMTLIERTKKTQTTIQTELDQLKVELETTKKSLEEKDHEVALLKSKLKLFETLKKPMASVIPSTPTTTPITATPVISTTTPTQTTNVAATSTIPNTTTTTTTTPTIPTELPKKRLIKKPAPSQLQNLIDSSKVAANVSTTVATPPTPTITTTTIPPSPSTITTTTIPPTVPTVPSIFSSASIFKNPALTTPLSPSSISNSPSLFSPNLTSTTSTPITFGGSTTPIGTTSLAFGSGTTVSFDKPSETIVTVVPNEPVPTTPSTVVEKPISPETTQPVDQLMEDEEEGILTESEDEEEEDPSQHVVKKFKVDNSVSIPTYENDEYETEDQTIEDLDDTNNNNNNNQVEEIEENNDSSMIDVDNSTGSTNSVSNTNTNINNNNNNTPISTSQEIPTTPTSSLITQKRRLKKNPLVPVPDNLVPPSQITKKPYAKSSTPTLISSKQPATTTQPPISQEESNNNNNNNLSLDPQTPTDDTIN